MDVMSTPGPIPRLSDTVIRLFDHERRLVILLRTVLSLLPVEDSDCDEAVAIIETMLADRTMRVDLEALQASCPELEGQAL